MKKLLNYLCLINNFAIKPENADNIELLNKWNQNS